MSCCSFAANTVRLQLHAPAYNLANFMRTLAPPETGIRVEAIGDLAQVRTLVLAHLHRVGS
jgi:hypothetical protein